MPITRLLVAALAVTLAASPAVAQAPAQKSVELPNTKAAKRLREYLDVIEKGGADRQKAFLKESVSDTLVTRRGETQMLGMLSQLNQREGAFLVTKIESSVDSAITVLATSKKSGITFKVGVFIQKTEPFRIRGILIDTMGPVERE
jgi:hypothetical protein